MLTKHFLSLEYKNFIYILDILYFIFFLPKPLQQKSVLTSKTKPAHENNNHIFTLALYILNHLLQAPTSKKKTKAAYIFK